MFQDPGDGRRPSILESLRFAATELLENGLLLAHFHAVGDHGQAKGLSHADERFHDRRIFGLPVDPCDGAAVDLEPG
jgi:hypothetical protein